MFKVISLPQSAFVNTLERAANHTCPLCSKCCDESTSSKEKEYDTWHYWKFFYCTNCNIIFGTNCIQNRSPHTTYYAKLISEFENENGELFKGMPVFESYKQMLKLYPKMKTTLVCMCTGKCTHSYSKTLEISKYVDVKIYWEGIYYTCPMCCTASDTEVVIKDDYVRHYCLPCKIIFDAGCIHEEKTDNAYYPIFITEFQNKHNEIIKQMPVFKSYEHMLNKLPKINPIFKCTCPALCPKSKN